MRTLLQRLFRRLEENMIKQRLDLLVIDTHKYDQIKREFLSKEKEEQWNNKKK